MLMTLRILRGIAGFFAIWQIIGLLPVLTNWLPNANSTTGSMWAIAFVKFLVLLICSAAFYWLGRIKKKYENADAPTTELPAIAIVLVAALAIGLVAAFVIPNLSKESAQQAAIPAVTSKGTSQAMDSSHAPPHSVIQMPAGSSISPSTGAIQGEWQCTGIFSKEPSRLILHSDGSVSGTVGSGPLLNFPWLYWYFPIQESGNDRVVLLRIRVQGQNSIVVQNPNDSVENCVR